MSIQTLIFGLTFALPLFVFTNTSYASDKYTPCIDNQIEMVKNLAKLTFAELDS